MVFLRDLRKSPCHNLRITRNYVCCNMDFSVVWTHIRSVSPTFRAQITPLFWQLKVANVCFITQFLFINDYYCPVKPFWYYSTDHTDSTDFSLVQSVWSVLYYRTAIVQNRFFSKSILGNCKLLETRCNLQSPQKMVSFLMPILNAPPFAPYPTSSRNSMAKVVPLPTWLSYT